jgi:hypothetical protein
MSSKQAASSSTSLFFILLNIVAETIVGLIFASSLSASTLYSLVESFKDCILQTGIIIIIIIIIS